MTKLNLDHWNFLVQKHGMEAVISYLNFCQENNRVATPDDFAVCYKGWLQSSGYIFELPGNG